MRRTRVETEGNVKREEKYVNELQLALGHHFHIILHAELAVPLGMEN